jgi:3-demethoxyubiquinol 3-hydroxylase
LGNRILKVNHAGGARRHRAIFEEELRRRGRPRCRSYRLCGLGGLILGVVTGLCGRSSISATTVAVESVVLGHLEGQMEALNEVDPDAYAAIRAIVDDEAAAPP